ncbi:MAG: hypothetical protein AAF086_00240 [Planctomycetota bacterium]
MALTLQHGKPMVTTLSGTQAMVAASVAQGAPLMSCSRLRYADNLRTAIAKTSH